MRLWGAKHPLLLFKALLVIFVFAGCGSTRGGSGVSYDPPDQASLPPIPRELQLACDTRIPLPGVAPDVEGVAPSASEIKITQTLNQKPPRNIAYLGTRGVLYQSIEAIPDKPQCSMGSPLILGRPLKGQDAKYNSDCCPPGLFFKSGTSIEISGKPEMPGIFDRDVLLCGYCKSAASDYWYPIRARIHWEIEGKKPRRLK